MKLSVVLCSQEEHVCRTVSDTDQCNITSNDPTMLVWLVSVCCTELLLVRKAELQGTKCPLLTSLLSEWRVLSRENWSEPSQSRQWSWRKPNCYSWRGQQKQRCKNRGILKPSWVFTGTNIFGPSGVRALPLAAGRNKGGHYWSERSACAALGCWHKRRWPLFWSERSACDQRSNLGGHYFR